MDQNSESKIELTANNLKNALWDTLQKVQSGNMEPGQADSIATSAREILRTTSVQLKVAQQSKRPIPSDVLSFSENQK
ncbi:hypothetical protein DYBT9275_02743 [Dyadobacter sp. CECT 9275]|uniref:Uncharacterized protein n=1 Tax=Dyadobacter helix TaxID=2822344 RepID=A0A916JCR6_9BACT|nr:hypothetical protein DYBT9275_02743 [Dyadobacter sp. CECT 9275]